MTLISNMLYMHHLGLMVSDMVAEQREGDLCRESGLDSVSISSLPIPSLPLSIIIPEPLVLPRRSLVFSPFLFSYDLTVYALGISLLVTSSRKSSLICFGSRC